MLISGHTCASIRHLSTTPDSPLLTNPPSDSVADAPTPPKPRRPSPYRLLPPHTFLAHFAPLHVAGWRLDLLPSIVQLSEGRSGNNGDGAELRREVQEGMADLQDRRLVRMWEFGEGKDGWRGLMRFAQTVGQIVEEEDHHPTITISPASDYRPTSTSLSTPNNTRGYVLEISTHTHTPMPPLPSHSDGLAQSSANNATKMRPGVTGKDLRLAERLEEAFGKARAGVEI
ncbi:hypothetical protein JCM24511_02984 [Saitozyma sp. JCM 24511]|nr:hypothetical protein JCM24511_02984 [Saitozyma sp. JCM 24511]